MLLFLVSCKKELEVIPDNDVPPYDAVPTLLVRNYVNRLYIDLIGREPLDAEMETDVAFLRSGDLSGQVRNALVVRLMTDSTWVDGDSSLAHAYYRRQYDMYKSRFLEGASDEVIDGFIGQALQDALADPLGGDTASANSEVEKLRNVKRIPVQYRRGQIGMAEVHRRLVFNAVYDEIHMNAFNFVNATFDNLYFRNPTNTEFNTAYAMVEHNTSGVLFGQGGQNKLEYAGIITSNSEYMEGMVRWCYQTFLGRTPSAQEVFSILPSFQLDQDLQRVQRNILTSDEYAGFGQ
jgi:hypothetical protein